MCVPLCVRVFVSNIVWSLLNTINNVPCGRYCFFRSPGLLLLMANGNVCDIEKLVGQIVSLSLSNTRPGQIFKQLNKKKNNKLELFFVL